jgi:hypothetical protein
MASDQTAPPWAAAWVDPTFVADPAIDHLNERVQLLAIELHVHEHRHHHDGSRPYTCAWCARRATTAIRFLDAIA